MQKVLTAANCITIPLRDFARDAIQLFQVRSDLLVRLLAGEKFYLPYSELYEFIPPAYITELPSVLDPRVDFFLWSAMVDETTIPINFYGIPFSPDIAYGLCISSEKIDEFYNRYPTMPKLSLEEREKNYLRVDALVTAANPNVIKILIAYDVSRLADRRLDRALEYSAAEKHMQDVLVPLGWKVYSVPPRTAKREDDDFWSHYSWPWTQTFIRKIMIENGYKIC